MRRLLPIVVFVLCLSASMVTAARAQAPGALVVRAQVVAVESRWDAARVLHTYVTVDVTRVVVGSGVPARLVIKQLGGYSNGIGLRIDGQATFRSGEDVLLDLTTRADGTLQTAGLGRGKWLVTTDAVTGTTSARQDADGPGLEVQRPLGDVERALAGGRPPLQRFRAFPAEYTAAPGDVEPSFARLPTDGGYPARWHEVDEDVQLFVDRAPIPATWTHATPAHVTSAVSLWQSSGMELDLRLGVDNLSASACPALTYTGNGRIAVAFNDPCAGVNDWVVGGGYYTTGDLRTVNGVEYQKFTQGFVVLNDTGVQATSAGCFQDAVTHGLGHALGLGHTDSAGAIMRAGPPAGCGSAPSGLGGDDVTGITTIYRGIPSGATPPNTPTAFTVTSSLSTVIMNWTPASTGGQAQRFLIDAGTAPGTYNLGTLVANAPTTSLAVGPAGVGVYYLRLRAQNALGTSAPTPERSVNVGNCTAPPPPASFTASSNDNVVNLQWTPPASGVVQGYQVVAGSAPGGADLAVLPFPSTVTALAGAVPYATYYVRVQATNVCGTSAPSAEVTLVVQPCAAAPQAPLSLTGSQSGGVISIGWAAPAAGPVPTGYTIVVGSAPGASNILVYPTGTTATGLAAPAPAGTYYVRVIATNPCGQSGASNEVVVTVP